MKRDERRPFVVTVTTTHFVEVTARDEDHARTTVERRLQSDYGRNRFPRIDAVEEALPVD